MFHRYWWQQMQLAPTTSVRCIRMMLRTDISIWVYRFLVRDLRHLQMDSSTFVMHTSILKPTVVYVLLQLLMEC